MTIKELVENFKGKDKWFESCYRYMNSIIETMEVYKRTRNLKDNIPEA